MKVLTALSAPVATSSVDIQVFVRAAENIEFANPSGQSPWSPFVMQAEEYAEIPSGTMMSLGENAGTLETVRNRVYMGEQVRSLRPLLRRINLLDSLVPVTNTTNLGYWRVVQRRIPPYYGYDANGIETAKGITATTTTFNVNFTNVLPYHMIANCFVAQKGSFQWHYNWDGPDVTLKATRGLSTAASSVGYVGTAVGSSSTNAQTLLVNAANTLPGTAVTNQKTNASISVSMPNYTVFKFQTTDPSTATTGTTADGSNFESFTVEVDNFGSYQNLSTGRLERYVGVGTDFNVYFFLNCPSLYYYSPANMVAV